MPKMSYFRDPGVEATAARILTPEQRRFVEHFPRSYEFRDHLKEQIEEMRAKIDHFERLLLLHELCVRLGLDPNEAICYPDCEDYDESKVAR